MGLILFVLPVNVNVSGRGLVYGEIISLGLQTISENSLFSIISINSINKDYTYTRDRNTISFDL